MANTTEMIITCVINDEAIALLSKKTGVAFNKISDCKKSGGDKALYFECYASCNRSLGKEKIQEIVSEFNSMDMRLPNLSALIIDDDDGYFNGVVLRKS